ncbi:MAG: carboxymuconolactone decarboxylase family protein [Alphaproteobacteria bacterium]|nr:carboxymuconolactone decarboxylase family protein [Alphaproteobacteria bacterium]
MTRDELRQRGEALRAELGEYGAAETRTPQGEPAPGFDRLMTEVTFGDVWGRDGLALRDRMICSLAVLCLMQHRTDLKRAIAAALDIGLNARAITEVFVQCGLYGGFPLSGASLAIADEVFAARGVTIAPEPERDDSFSVLDARGREILQTLHGDRGTGGYADPGNPVTGALYESAVRYGYGELWDRPGLDRRSRMLCALASFTALGLDSQVKKFGQSAVNVGLKREEVIEAVIQTAPYSGFPKALNALALLSDVL